MPFKKKKFRNRLEARLDDLASQTEDLRKQVVDRAPGVRDSLVDMLPDKVKPKKRSKLKRVAFLGVLTGAGAAAFAALKGKGNTPPPPAPFPAPPTPSSSAGTTPKPAKKAPTKKA